MTPEEVLYLKHKTQEILLDTMSLFPAVSQIGDIQQIT